MKDTTSRNNSLEDRDRRNSILGKIGSTPIVKARPSGSLITDYFGKKK